MLIQTQQQFDVIICGATVSGIAAAITYAQNGVRVALIDSASDMIDRLDYITPAADHLLRSVLRVEPPSSTPAKLEFWTRWGWIRSDGTSDSYFVRAQELRVRLLNNAYYTPGVTLFRETAIEQLIKDGATIIGIKIRQTDSHRPLQLLARLIVAADGSDPQLAQLIGSNDRQQSRVYYRAFYELSGLPRAQFWLLNPDVAAIIAHGSGLTEVIYAPGPALAAVFQQDTEGSFAHALAQLPDAPHMPDSARITQVVAITTTALNDNHPGLALVGRARFSMPLFRANQLSMDLESTHSLVEHTLQALMVTGEIESALQAYRQQCRQATRAYRQHNDELLSGRRFNQAEKLALTAAARNPAAAERFFAYLCQSLTRGQLLRPGNFLQALRSGETPTPTKPLSVPQSP